MLMVSAWMVFKNTQYTLPLPLLIFIFQARSCFISFCPPRFRRLLVVVKVGDQLRYPFLLSPAITH